MKQSTLTLGNVGGDLPSCSCALKPIGQSFGGPRMSQMPECGFWCQLNMVTLSKTCKCMLVCMYELLKFCYMGKVV